MRMIVLPLIIAFGVTASSIGAFYSVAFATHGGDHCSLEQHLALIQKGYNNKQEADICDGRSLDANNDYSTDTDKLLNMLGVPQRNRVTFCHTQYGQCPLNNAPTGAPCFCTHPNGTRVHGFVR